MENSSFTTEEITEGLFRFIDNSPTAFHAVQNAARMLEEAGYKKIVCETAAGIRAGGRYYATRNDSALIAFRIPAGKMKGLRIAASHSDSPCFKVKETPEMDVEGHYVKLNTEGYGGMIMSTWLDRPLSVAGRAILMENGRPVTKLVNIDRDLCIIPNVAIHFNREINKGFAYNPQVDLLPLYGGVNPEASSENEEENKEKLKKKSLKALCAESLGVSEEDILASDLYLYTREKGRRMGVDGEFIVSPRLDDLQCAYGTLAGFLAADDGKKSEKEAKKEAQGEYGAVYALFDNEEIGSGTKQGADSTFLSDVIQCICDALELSGSARRDLLAGSFLLSADNAHGVHPNHPEKSDPTNRPYLNGGIVLKFQGSQKYTTDAYSAAVVRNICKEQGVPCQNFANRADVAGGSTLGNISSAHVSIPAADIGLAQLAMHSALETAGVKDTEYLVRLCQGLFL